MVPTQQAAVIAVVKTLHCTGELQTCALPPSDLGHDGYCLALCPRALSTAPIRHPRDVRVANNTGSAKIIEGIAETLRVSLQLPRSFVWVAKVSSSYSHPLPTKLVAFPFVTRWTYRLLPSPSFLRR